MKLLPSIAAQATLLGLASIAAVFAACGPDNTTSGGTTTGSAGSSSQSSSSQSSSSSQTSSGGGHDSGPPPGITTTGLCALPGSIQFVEAGTYQVPGGIPNCSPQHDTNCSVDLSFLHLPPRFCAHFYGSVGNTRQIRFAPGGELFVASPTEGTTGGGAGGKAAIVLLPDDDHDGYADKVITFLPGLTDTQGLMFANGHFYYQDHTKIMRIPYASGDRQPQTGTEEVIDVTVYFNQTHWPKTLDISDDGTIYVGNGGEDTDPCVASHPFHGGILSIDGSAGGKLVAKGLRNPIAIRCLPGKNRCFAAELAKDFSFAPNTGREKIIPIRDGDDWGFPCCATQNTPYKGNPNTCANVAAENVSFYIGDTPFGLAFEQSGKWPAAWGGRVYIPLHGAAGTWTGSRIVSVGMNAQTGDLEPGSTLMGDMGSTTDFATGYDDHSLAHGRPAAVEFSSDGRLFVGNDNDGSIIWIAPFDL